jgi:hypothetical protein
MLRQPSPCAVGLRQLLTLSAVSQCGMGMGLAHHCWGRDGPVRNRAYEQRHAMAWLGTRMNVLHFCRNTVRGVRQYRVRRAILLSAHRFEIGSAPPLTKSRPHFVEAFESKTRRMLDTQISPSPQHYLSQTRPTKLVTHGWIGHKGDSSTLRECALDSTAWWPGCCVLPTALRGPFARHLQPFGLRFLACETNPSMSALHTCRVCNQIIRPGAHVMCLPTPGYAQYAAVQ